MDICEYNLTELLDYLSEKHVKRQVKRWDAWTIFIEDLPVILIDDLKNEYLAWYKRYSSGPLNCIEKPDHPWMHLAWITPKTGQRGFHRIMLITEAIKFKSIRNYRVIVFLSSSEKNQNYPTIAYIKKGGKEEPIKVKCHCLWGTYVPKKDTLIEYCYSLEDKWKKEELNKKQEEVCKAIGDTLCLDYENLDIENKEIENNSNFTNGDLIEVHNPGNEEILYGVVWGKCPNKLDVLFLRLTSFQDFHPGDTHFIPIDKSYSIMIPEFRFAPKEHVTKWKKSTKAISQKIKGKIINRLEVYFEKN